MFSRAIATDTPGTASEPAGRGRFAPERFPAIGTIGRISVHRQGRTSSDGFRSLPPQTRYTRGRISRDRART
jgi:hypothetical protein